MFLSSLRFYMPVLFFAQNLLVLTAAKTFSTFEERPYKGRLIGQLQPLKKTGSPTEPAQFRISGTVYAVDEQLLYIDHLTFDGGIQGLQLWGITTNVRTRSQSVFIISIESECLAAPTCTPLPAIWDENLLIALPRNHSLNSITEIVLATRNKTVLYPTIAEIFAVVKLPPTFLAPHSVILPTRLAHTISAGGTSSGKIIIQDSRRIYLDDVTFDGSGKNAYFWVDRSTLPTIGGFMVPPNNDESPPQPLTKLPKSETSRYDVLLNLRRAFRPISGNIQALTVFDLKSVAIFDRNYETVFGDAPFDGPSLKGRIPPALDDLTVHRISDKAQLLLRELNYRINSDNEILMPSTAVFPRPSIFTSGPQNDAENLVQNDDPVPPKSEVTRHSSNAWNCEILENILEVQWKIELDYVTITLSLPTNFLPNDDNFYIAFGISGHEERSEMVGSDVTIAHRGSRRMLIADFILGGQKACDLNAPKINAVCPRSIIGGKQASKLFGGSGVRDGKMSLTFRRPLEGVDIISKKIDVDKAQYIVWAVGTMNSTTTLPEGHSLRSTESKALQFGRVPQNNCIPQTTPTLNSTILTTPGPGNSPARIMMAHQYGLKE